MKAVVITRRDLSPSQRTVQSCHAMAELFLRHRNDPGMLEWASDHRTLVLLGVDGEEGLARLEERFQADGLPHATFREPDMRDERTAIALHPSCDRKLVKKLPLL